MTMKGSTIRRKSLSLLAAFMLGATLAIPVHADGTGGAADGAGDGRALPSAAGLSEPDGIGLAKYDDYIRSHEGKPRPDRTVDIPVGQYETSGGMEAETLDGFEGAGGKAVRTGEEGTITWSVDVPEDGLYNIGMTYFPIPGKSSAIERKLAIDGRIPFAEAAVLDFNRSWGNLKVTIERDNQGNELRPEQTEKPIWLNDVFHDGEGYYAKPFLFYFAKGRHTVSLISAREPMVVSALKLFREPDPPAYKILQEAYKAQGYAEANNAMVEVQGEDAAYKSSPTLYPVWERSSSAVSPYSPSRIRINSVGGYNWRMPGEWIEWNIAVPKSGLYKIGFNVKQNYVRDLFSTRRLTIDGKVPFREMDQIQFRFKNDYRMEVLGGDRPYLFYLTAGTHTLRLTNTLGDVSDLIRQVENTVLNLNVMYRKILMITGSTPDRYRDYQLDKQIPDMIGTFRTESRNLRDVQKKLETIAGHHSQQEAALSTMADQLDDMVRRPETIPQRLVSYTTNVGSLGDWVLSIREQPLQIDALYVASPDKELPAVHASFFDKLRHEFVTFLYSFVIDYTKIGDVSDGKSGKTIEVWITTGRDQAQIIKALIDDTFTPQTGIRVNLNLVQPTALLPATLSGQGPDVALEQLSDVPVNYAMRGAVADLSKLPDFPEVEKRFRPSAMTAFKFDGGVYALPETQSFSMLFYRKDILQDLNLNVPNTWQDVYAMLPVLDKNHMEFGIQRPAQINAYYSADSKQVVNVYPDPNPTMVMLLYQNVGQFYADGGKRSGLDSVAGMKAFQQWTEFYTEYGLPKEFDFGNRFRTGEMPIGIADYTIYNQLMVFAPEIKGLWSFTTVPGTIQPDGSVRKDVGGGGYNCVIMKQSKDKASSWEFLKWWTSADTQTMFGREMEGLMGAAGRWPTANIQAFGQLPWPAEDFRKMGEQYKWVRGIPQVPGGYFTGRHLDNAFWKVVNVTSGSGDQKKWYKLIKTLDYSVGPRETLEPYVQYINDEIRQKRREFGLPAD